MNDIFDEMLDDEKNYKRLESFKKALPMIIFFTIVISITISGYSWISRLQSQRNKILGDSFIQLVSNEYIDRGLLNNLLKEISVSKENKVHELALIKLLNTQLELNNILEAMQLIESIVLSKNYSEITTSYARILYITLILDINHLTNSQETKTKEYLEYFSKDSQVFYTTATLLKSLFYFKNNQLNSAKKYALKIISLPKAPGAIKEQASIILSWIDKEL